ncbi:MAG TPA: hypothetical protein VK253_00895 [Candidatus Binatia bacterium]|nr:hypothetical protein [Candidatus Binatia bacterium]
MIIDDILKVVYAPHKVFKDIVTNPKYLGALIVLILFIGLEVGYEYSQFTKTYTEQTTPTIDQLSSFTNATAWSSPNAALTNNFADYINYSVYIAGFGLPPQDPKAYYSLYGNSSLEMQTNNTSSITATLTNTTDVDCSPSGFQNFTISLKQTEAPQNAILKLYSLRTTDFYQYDLTPLISSTSKLNEWNNLTIALGPNAAGWTPHGNNPQWYNITSLELDFSYPSSSNKTVEIGALFFHGEYLSPVQYNSTGVALQFLQLFSLQFLIAWFVFTGIIYLLCRIMKSSVTWKALFVAIGFAMFIMVIRGLVNLAATLTMPTIYYPYDLSLGLRFDPYAALYYPVEALRSLPAASVTIFNSINSATYAFRTIVTAMFVVSYVWLGAVGTMVIGALRPEFSLIKRITISAVSLGVVILVLIFLVGSI